MLVRRLLVVFGLCWSAAATLPAQLPPLTVPRGLLRLDFGGRFDNWSRRFLDGTRQDAAGDFIRSSVTGAFFAPLALDEAELRRVTGVQAISLSLGASSSSMLVNVGTASIGAAYGVTSRLTLFGTVPIVRVRVQNRFDLDTTQASAGFNPAHPLFGDPALSGQAALFVGQLGTALGTIAANLEAGVYDGDPARRALAEQTLAQGTEMERLFLDATFLPLEGSAGAASVATPVEELRAAINGLSVSGFTAAPVFPEARITGPGFESFATRTGGPIEADPFQPPILQYLGDIEVGAAYAWLDRRPEGGMGIRSVIQAIVRLRTGQLDDPAGIFDLPTGDRQPDVQGDLVTDFMAGGVGARVTARYVYQLPGRLSRRITPPDQPIAPVAFTAALERDPGEIIELGVEPYLRIAPTLALTAGFRRWSKGADKFSYVRNQPPIEGVSPETLAIGTRENGMVASAGLSYVHGGRRKDGSIGLPMDVALRFEQVIGSSLGRVPVRQTLAVQLRLYRKLF
jgi:hypothetical protein